mgnify:CR=1 FL=1
MKIGYIGKFQRIYDEEGIARSLEKLGVEVIRFEVSEFELNYSLTLEKIQNSNLDYLMCLLLVQATEEELQEIITTAKPRQLDTSTIIKQDFYPEEQPNLNTLVIS